MTERPLLWIFAGLVAITIGLAVAADHFALPPRPLTQITSPTFPPVAWPSTATALRTMDAHLQRPAGHERLARLIPDQAGVFWLALIVLLVAGIDYARPAHGRNWDLLATQAIAWFLWEVLTLFEETSAPEFLGYIRLMFSVSVIIALWVAARAVWVCLRPYADTWRPAAGERMLVAIAAAVTVLALTAAFMRTPDDSSYFSNLGGQRLRERGLLPYGDPLLTGTPGAAYAPGMYLLHAGTQILLGEPANSGQDNLSLSTLNGGSHYMEPPAIVTQLLLAIFHLIAVAALAWIGWRWQGVSLAAALVALYSASAAILGTGGAHDSVMGITFVSHVIPPAITLAAFAALANPLVSGVLLALAAWTGFYPAFFGPVWLGWYWGRGMKDSMKFAAGVAVISALMLAWVLLDSRPAPGLSLVATIVRDTFGHHTDPAGYGSSPFGLWGQATGLAAVFGTPLGSSPFTAPFFLLFLGFLVWGAWAARTANAAGLALLTAAVGIGATVWKVHATGTYMTWYYPFLLLGFLGTPPAAPADR